MNTVRLPAQARQPNWIIPAGLFGAFVICIAASVNLEAVLACFAYSVFLCLLVFRAEWLLYAVFACALVFIDGWTPTRDPDTVVFRLGLGKLYLLELPIYALLASLIWRRWFSSSGETWHFARTAIDRPLLAFTACLPIFAFYGLLLGNKSQDAVGYYEWRCLFLGIAFFYLTLNLLRSPERMEKLFWFFVAVATLKAVYSLAVMPFHVPEWLGRVFGQGAIGEGPENVMFVFLALASLAVLHFGRPHAPSLKALCWVAALTSMANIALSQKRDPQLGFAIGFAFLFWKFSWRQRRRWLGAAAVVAVLLTTAKLVFETRVSEGGGLQASVERYSDISAFIESPLQDTTPGDTFAFHVLDWFDGWNTIKQRPLLGYGFGSKFDRQLTLLNNVGGEEVGNGMIHNQYLTIWLKSGIIGLSMFVWLLVAILRMGHRAARTVGRSDYRALAIAFTAAIYSVMAMEMWGATWAGDTKPPILYFTAIAMLTCFAGGARWPGVSDAN